MNFFEKAKTFLTSRRAWVTAVFLAYIVQFLIPFVEEYLGYSFDFVKDVPKDQQAEAFAVFMLGFATIVVTVSVAPYKIISNLIKEWTVRPPTMADAFAVYEVVVDTVEAVKDEVADLSDDGQLNDSNK